MSSVLIIGGGAAGMMAAIAAGYNGNEVHLFEKNDRLGKKIFISGRFSGIVRRKTGPA